MSAPDNQTLMCSLSACMAEGRVRLWPCWVGCELFGKGGDVWGLGVLIP